MSFPTRKIGTDDVSAIGFGAMGISAFYGEIEPDEQRFKVLDAAHENGCTFWDTANVYGDSEELIGKWFKRTGKRNEIFLATKFGIDRNKPNGVDGSPENARACFARSLERLGVESIDLYYLHRPDPQVPIEVTVGALAEFVKAGKAQYIGLSECSADTLRRAHAVHPIAAVQVEYSPFTLDIEDPKLSILKTARELGIKIIAYSPLGRGLLIYHRNLLTTLRKAILGGWCQGNFRRYPFLTPTSRHRDRYSKENFPNILKLVEKLKNVGEGYHASAGQVALAWLLAQGDDVIPIPGTKKVKYLKENLDAVKATVSPESVQEVRSFAEKADWAIGERYPPSSMQMLFAETPALQSMAKVT